MNPPLTRVAPELVGQRAAAIWAALQADPEYDRLAESTALHPDRWATFTGYPLVAEFDLDRDSWPLFTEATKVLALKAAVFELTSGNEAETGLMVSAPVSEMMHGVIAQYTLLVRIQERLGIHWAI